MSLKIEIELNPVRTQGVFTSYTRWDWTVHVTDGEESYVARRGSSLAKETARKAAEAVAQRVWDKHHSGELKPERYTFHSSVEVKLESYSPCTDPDCPKWHDNNRVHAQ